MRTFQRVRENKTLFSAELIHFPRKASNRKQTVLLCPLSYSFRESRYLLVLTENYAALPIVQKELHKKGKEPVIIFGSSFPKDQEYTKVLTVISAFPLVP